MIFYSYIILNGLRSFGVREGVISYIGCDIRISRGVSYIIFGSCGDAEPSGTVRKPSPISSSGTPMGTRLASFERAEPDLSNDAGLVRIDVDYVEI